jgi:hypothetical protein
MNYLEAIAFLKTYGLDKLLSTQDDANLWATVIKENWPLPDDPIINIESLEFQLGEIDESSPIKIKVSERWCFERVDDKRLNVVECKTLDPQPVIKMEEEWWKDFDKLTPEEVLEKIIQHNRVMGYPFITLCVTRPSKNQDKAIVFSACQGAPLLGGGAAREWYRQTDGSWLPNSIVWGYQS